MNAIDVLIRMGDLRAALTHPLYQRYAHGVQEDIAKKRNGPTINDQQGRPSGYHFCLREAHILELASAYFVTAQMQQLIEGASYGLDESDQFAQDLWPTQYGFLMFEDGYKLIDVRGEQLVTHAISWHRASGATMTRPDGAPVNDPTPGTMVALYTDPRDMRDSINVKMVDKGMTPERMAMGNLVVTHLQWFRDGWKVGPMLYSPGDEEEILKRFGTDLDGNKPRTDNLVNDGRFFLSMLMMLNQAVTSMTRHEAAGRDAKRLRRMKVPGAVTVIQLRHKVSKQQSESDVEWQHQWIVRGHWRWQPYGARGSRNTHAHEMDRPVVVGGKRVRHCTVPGCDYHEDRIYINPYVKGPEDKPLKQTTKVYALVR